jgi:hypothetical protein
MSVSCRNSEKYCFLSGHLQKGLGSTMKIPSFVLALFLTACGGYETSSQPPAGPTPQPTPNPTPGPGGPTSFADVSKIMGQFCVECHAGAAFTKGEQQFRASSAKARVQNGTMPPPYATQMDATSKQKFLGF